MNEIGQTSLNRTLPTNKLLKKPVINNSKTTPAKSYKTQTNSVLKQSNSETKAPSLNRSTTYIVDSLGSEILSNSEVQVDIESMEKPKTKSSPIKNSSSLAKKASDVSNSAKKSTSNTSTNNKNNSTEPNENSKASIRPSLAQLKQKKREELLKTKTSSQLEASRPESALSKNVENILKSSHRTGTLNLSNLELEEGL